MSRDIDRRTILRGAAAASAVALAGGLGLRALRRQPERWDEAAFPPPGDARVAVLAASNYDGPLEATVQDGLRAIGADVRGANILLKPNLVEFDPTTAVNTDPRLIAASVLALRRLGAVSVRVAVLVRGKLSFVGPVKELIGKGTLDESLQRLYERN